MSRTASSSSQRVALVTGAAGTLGVAISDALGRNGMRVVLTDTDPAVADRADELAAEHIDAVSAIADLREPDRIVGLVDSVVAEHGRIDVLVNNAGVHPLPVGEDGADIERTDLDAWRLAFEVNLTAPFLLIKSALPHMRAARSGRIINIASRAARTAMAGSAPHYSATKSGLVGLTRSVAVQSAAWGITCNAVAPGRFPSPLSNAMTLEQIAESLRQIPLGRAGAPTELGAAVAFLASLEASYITGAVLDVNGGAFIG